MLGMNVFSRRGNEKETMRICSPGIPVFVEVSHFFNVSFKGGGTVGRHVVRD